MAISFSFSFEISFVAEHAKVETITANAKILNIMGLI
jgi:hypothetical protein